MSSNTKDTQAPDTVTSAEKVSPETPPTSSSTPNLATDAQRWLDANFERTTYNGTNEGLRERVLTGIETVAQAIDEAPAALGALADVPLLPESVRERWRWDPDAPADFERAEEVMDALYEFLGSEQAAVLFCRGFEWMPDEVHTNARLGFRPPDRYRVNPKDKHVEQTEGGDLVYTCGLTKKKFALPIGAPVPVVMFDQERGVGGASQKNPWIMDVHPRIYLEGPGAVFRALWGSVMEDLNEAFQTLALAVMNATAACSTLPKDYGSAPASAFRGYEGEINAEAWKDL